MLTGCIAVTNVSNGNFNFQINTEVKRLLVASVGEDIEAKVDYLTQDKARLSADIRQYASKISRDFEEKEQLSVESNLWKSKFLACSVIVDELARWKASLLHRTEATEHNFRLVLHEHAVLWDSLIRLYQLLAKLRNAFDPLAPPIRYTYSAGFKGQKVLIFTLWIVFFPGHPRPPVSLAWLTTH